MDKTYLITPLLTWFMVGSIKFLINCFSEKRFAFDLIGYGGMPSNHSAIVCSMVSIILFKDGVGDPAFGIAISFAFIVMLDAYNLRGEIEKHAKAINKLKNKKDLRERIGHSAKEIFCGAIVGILSAWLIYEYF